MNTGSAFYIGKTHEICQDYTGHNTSPIPYIVVSDGCSGSPNTDIGARIVTRIISDSMGTVFGTEIAELISDAHEARSFLNLPPESLDATIMCSYVTDGVYHTHLFGDGVIAKTRKNGAIQIVRVEYPSGAPLYLNYSSDKIRMKGYEDTFSLNRRIYFYDLEPDGTILNFKVEDDSTGESYYESGNADNYNTISLMSDGILSFYELINTGTSKIQMPVEPNNVLRKLLDFKGFQGDFVARRFQKFRKDCEKMNWFHADDLSLATIYLGSENAQNN